MMKKTLLALAAGLALAAPSGAGAAEQVEISTTATLPGAYIAPGPNFVSTNANAKAFAGARQAGQPRNIIAVWNCNVVTSGAVRIDVTECSIRTDATSVNRPGYGYIAVAPHAVTQSPVLGSRIIEVCVVAVVYFRTGAPFTTPRNCSPAYVSI